LLGRGFVDRYYELSREKDSFLCAGIDPVTADMRDRYVIPPELVERHGFSGGIKRFCLDVIEAVAPFVPVIKPNAQFITYPLSFDDLRELVEAIHEGGCLALLDAKLSDIGSTNAAGLHRASRTGATPSTGGRGRGIRASSRSAGCPTRAATTTSPRQSGASPST
jgi:orotidine-5'-phosphate decarboxylase